MVRIRRTLQALTFGIAIISHPATAQIGASTSLTHTVSVTVPPRVKVQVGTVALSASPVNHNASLMATTQSLSLQVSATRAWVLSIESRTAATTQKSSTRWSVDAKAGYVSLPTDNVTIASGDLSSGPQSAQLFFRSVGDATAMSNQDTTGSPVVLTVAAP